MNEISCDVCMDLYPLVRDGVASGDSVRAVRAHLESCPSCRELAEAVPAEDAEAGRVESAGRLAGRLRTFFGLVLLLGALFGASLTVGQDMFYNILIMPAIGIVSYCLFRWKGAMWTPAVIFAAHLFTGLIGRTSGEEVLTVSHMLMWSGIYSAFALTGVVIAGLMHYAFGREEKR